MTPFSVIRVIGVIVEVIMWIKTVSGNLVNSEFVKMVEYDGQHTTIKVHGEKSAIVVAYDEDVRPTIVQSIILGTKIMEV